MKQISLIEQKIEANTLKLDIKAFIVLSGSKIVNAIYNLEIHKEKVKELLTSQTGIQKSK